MGTTNVGCKMPKIEEEIRRWTVKSTKKYGCKTVP
jgi:hypothetical protein